MEINKKLERSWYLRKEFFKEFKFNAPLNVNISAVLGYLFLDIVELDNKIKTPDNVSTKDYVKQKFGDRAMKIVKEWISL